MSREIARKVIASFQEPVTVATEVEDLSPREREILRLIADGLGNEQIGTRLFISPQTVRTHVGKTMEKLEVHSRTEAVAVALRQKLIA